MPQAHIVSDRFHVKKQVNEENLKEKEKKKLKEGI